MRLKTQIIKTTSRVNLFVWRANLISSSGKGHEYFLKHLLGTTNGLMNDDSDSLRPEEIKWHEDAPEGKLDLLINLDFRYGLNGALF